MVFIEDTTNHYFQLKESRIALGADVQKIFRIHENHSVYVSGGFAYTTAANGTRYSEEITVLRKFRDRLIRLAECL